MSREISQDVYDTASEYVREHPELIARAASKVADKLIEAGWKINKETPDLWDAGFGLGVVVGNLIMHLHMEDEIEDDMFTPDTDTDVPDQDLTRIG